MGPRRPEMQDLPLGRLAAWLKERAHPGAVPLLEPGAWALAAAYGLWALVHAVGPWGGPDSVVAVAALSAFLLAATAAAAHGATDPGVRYGMAAAMGALVVGTAVFRMAVGPGPEEVTHLGLALVALGAFLRAPVFLSISGLAAVSWLLILSRFPDGELVSHYSGFLAASAVLGGVLLVVRRYRDLEVHQARGAEDGLNRDLHLTLGWYRTLFQESPALMCVHDTDGRIEEVNPAGLEALGYARQEVVGRMITEFMVPVTEDGPEQYLREIQRSGRTEGLLRARRADGSLRIWEYRSTILETGTNIQVLATAADVTELAEARDWVASELGSGRD